MIQVFAMVLIIGFNLFPKIKVSRTTSMKLAVSCVRANSEECSEERVMACMNNLLTSNLGDSTDDEEEVLCRQLRSTFDCLKEAVDDCLGDERDSEVDDKFEELEKLMSKCNAFYGNDNDEELEEIVKCYKQNEDYVRGCVNEGNQQALTLLIKEGDMDENTMKCELYRTVAGCYVDRIREKCGKKAASLAEEEASHMPDEVVEACNAAGEKKRK